MNWPSGGQWEWAVGEIIILPLLFFELYSVRRSQRRDREAARRAAETVSASDDPVAGTHGPPPKSRG